MIKSLFIIAGASFVLAAACFAGAAALGGGPGWWDHHWGPWPHGTWNFRVRDNDSNDEWRAGHDFTADGAQTTREIAWNGGDRLDLDIGANVTFTQAPGPAKLTISGPSEAVQAVELSGSHLQFKDDVDYSSPLTVTLTAPNVHSFAINGSGDLAINGYDQDELDVDVSGSGNVTAKGKARALKLDISGSGDVDAGGLAADTADADISGSGKASIAPASAADLHISGDGEIDLMSHPAKLTSDVSGSGHIVEGAAAPDAVAPAKGRNGVTSESHADVQ
jgi:Putative auto-transporter adhesin, head GIN domain